MNYKNWTLSSRWTRSTCKGVPNETFVDEDVDGQLPLPTASMTKVKTDNNFFFTRFYIETVTPTLFYCELQ